jgi:hypothetical protein
MESRCRRCVRRAPEQAELGTSPARQAIAQWMQADAENRAGRECADRDAVPRDLR